MIGQLPRRFHFYNSRNKPEHPIGLSGENSNVSPIVYFTTSPPRAILHDDKRLHFLWQRGRDEKVAWVGKSDSEWASKTSSKSCKICCSIFTLVKNRRHHCRKCGILVCNDCSPSRTIPDPRLFRPDKGEENKVHLIRICKGCFRQKTAKEWKDFVEKTDPSVILKIRNHPFKKLFRKI